jgi:hypothetical protein
MKIFNKKRICDVRSGRTLSPFFAEACASLSMGPLTTACLRRNAENSIRVRAGKRGTLRSSPIVPGRERETFIDTSRCRNPIPHVALHRFPYARNKGAARPVDKHLYRNILAHTCLYAQSC